MMPSTVLDHASADLAWDHRNYGTDRNHATHPGRPEAARNHRAPRTCTSEVPSGLPSPRTATIGCHRLLGGEPPPSRPAPVTIPQPKVEAAARSEVIHRTRPDESGSIHRGDHRPRARTRAASGGNGPIG